MFIKRILMIILLSVIIIIIGTFVYLYYFTPEKFLQSNLIQQQVKKQLGDEKAELFNLLPRLLGYTKPVTYLFLFQNNTELRPGGGFVGVYAVVRFDKGKMELLQIEGTEKLDKNSPLDWKIAPPKPISEHLKVDRWYFRDSNWSPDFAVNAKRAMEFYKSEGGIAAEQIDAVVAITPTVLEKLMEITGPFTIEGIKFAAHDVTEKLEYEVEYGYDERGIAFEERKQIIKPFFLALLQRLREDLFLHLSGYLELMGSMAEQKHILVYAKDTELQKDFDKRGWSGRVKEADGDYLFWTDANLAALKTDWTMKRELRYSITPWIDGGYLAKAEMNYQHQGKFDWRTTRYRTYARVFVPLGAELKKAGLIGTDGAEKQIDKIDSGEELGKQWFGTFISVEPGQTKSLAFEYILPDKISEQIKNGLHTLFVQKQLGTIAHQLTLDLNFGTNIVSAEPVEEEKERGDVAYKYQGDLRTDKEFVIKL